MYAELMITGLRPESIVFYFAARLMVLVKPSDTICLGLQGLQHLTGIFCDQDTLTGSVAAVDRGKLARSQLLLVWPSAGS